MSAQDIVSQQDDAATPPKRPYTISKETTYFTGPLKPDGSIDFIAAVNEHFSEGVTPENNAARIIVPLLDPRNFGGSEYRDRVVLALGLEPEKHPASRALLDVTSLGREPAENAEKFESEYYQALDRPWRDEEFPLVAKWLAENSQQMDTIARAAQMPRFYSPLVREKESELQMVCGMDVHRAIRYLARDFVIRANQRMASDQWERAWNDILAIKNLARLINQGGRSLDCLAGYAVDGIGNRAACEFIGAGKTELQWKSCLESWGSLTADNLKESIAVGDRAGWNEIVCRFSEKPESAGGLFEPSATITSQLLKKGGFKFEGDWQDRIRLHVCDFLRWNLAALIKNGSIDLDLALRKNNEAFDQIDRILELENPRERNEALKTASRQELAEDDGLKVMAEIVFDATKSRSERFAEAIQDSFDPFGLAQSMHFAQQRLETSHQVIRLALAARAIEQETGKLPDKLEMLDSLCGDKRRSNQAAMFPIEFRSSETEVVIYHWGVDRKDDRGDIDGKEPKDWGIRLRK